MNLLYRTRPRTAAEEAREYARVAQFNGGTVSVARFRLIADLIGAYMNCGAYGAMDDAAMLVAENAGSALVSLKRRTVMTATAAPTFTADAGYAFNGTTQFINTNFIPATHASRMVVGNVRLSVYERTNVGTTTNACGVNHNSSGSNLRIIPRSAANTKISSCNSNNGTFSSITDSRGLSVASRAGGGTALKGWKNGVALTDATVTASNTGLQGFALYIGGLNDAVGGLTAPRASTIGYVDWGAPLATTAQELAVYNALQAFMTAVGANV